MKLTLVLLLCAFFHGHASAGDHDYSGEINAIRDRARTYRDEALAQLDQLQEYDLALQELNWRGKEIQDAVEAAKNVFPESSRLQDIAREYAYLESVWDRLNLHERDLNAALLRADFASQKLPDMAGRQKVIRANSENALLRLRTVFGERREQNRRDQELWLKQREEEVLRQIAERRMKIVDELKFSEQIQETATTFRAIKFNFLLKGSQQDRKGAEILLIGYRWLKGTYPLYFALTTREQVEEFKRLQREVEEMEREMASRFAAWPRSHHSPAFSHQAGLLSLLAKGAKGEPKKELEVPPNKPEQKYKREIIRDHEGKEVTKLSAGKNRDVERHFVATRSMDFGMGYMAVEEVFHGPKIKRSVKVPRENELRKNLHREIKERVAAPTAKPSRPEPGAPQEPEEKIARNTERLRELIAEAERGASEKEAQANLIELSGAVAHYEALQKYLNASLDKSSSDLMTSLGKSEPMWTALATRPLPDAPRKGEEIVYGPGESGEDLAMEAAKKLAEFGFSNVPGYDFANFAYAMALDETIFGEGVKQDEKLMMGVFAAMTFLPGGKVMAKVVTNFGNAKTFFRAAVPFIKNTKGLKKIRDHYNFELTLAKQVGWKRLNSGQNKVEVAHWLCRQRREIGAKMKEQMPESLQKLVAERNIAKYGDPLGPTFDVLYEKHRKNGLSHDQILSEIIDSSTTSNVGINDFFDFIERISVWKK